MCGTKGVGVTDEGARLRVRLVFADTGVPLHHVHVRVEVDHLFLPDEEVASGWTDADGVLDVPLAGHGAGSHHLGLELLVRGHPDDGVRELPDDLRPEWPEVKCDTQLVGGVHDGGTVPVPFWPYREDWRLPRSRGADGEHDEENCEPVRDQLLREKVRFAPALAEHFAKALIPGHPTIPAIQEDYPESLTQRVDAATPGRSRTDAWIGERVLNGVYPLPLEPDPEAEGYVRWGVAWGDVPPDGTYDLTDVEARFELKDGLPVPVRLVLTVRRADDDRWVVEAPRTFTPEDAEWEAAKRVFRVHYLLAAEIDAHMTMAHIRVEQYGVAARRNLRRNPVGRLLEPHLREICATNDQADLVAWGALSATVRGSAFDTRHVQERMERTAGRENWPGYLPRAVISDHDAYGRGAAIYWDLLTEHVDAHLAAHADEIATTWIEIRRFSDDLVRHSAPYLPASGDAGAGGRVESNGVIRAIHPVSVTDEPAEGDLDRLAQLCRYVIFHATWWHAWVHDRQYDDGGEIRYASLALRGGSLGPEDDDDIAPAPVGATLGLGTISVGCAVQHGYLVADEDGDVPEGLRDRLLARRDELAALGIDIDRIRARINI
jgi:hypothetical protein